MTISKKTGDIQLSTKGLAIILFSIAPAHLRIYPNKQNSIINSIRKCFKTNNINQDHITDPKLKIRDFLLWGRYDILGTVHTDYTDTMYNITSLEPLENSTEQSIHFGNEIYSQENIYELLDKKILPIFAVSFIKCSEKYFQYRIENGDSSAKDIFISFIELCNKVRSINKLDKNLSYNISTSYGWNDFIITFASDSINKVKDFIYGLRSQTYPSEKNTINHTIKSTFTIPGLLIGGEKLESLKSNSIKLIKNCDETLSWNIKFRVKPGHLNWCQELFLSKELHSKTKAYPTTGTFDLLVKPVKDTKLSEFIEIFFSIFSASNQRISDPSKESPPIISMETVFHLDQLKREDNIPSKSISEPLYNLRDILLEVRDVGLKLFIPRHLMQSLINLATTLDHFSRIPSIQDDLYFIFENFLNFIKGIDEILFYKTNLHNISDNQKQKYMRSYIRNNPEMVQILTQLCTMTCENMKLIISERLRAAHPYEGGLYELPLVTYLGSFHKILQNAEWISEKINNIALRIYTQLFQREFNNPEFKLTDQKHTYLSSISNVECARIQRLDRTRYLFLPVDFLLFQEDVFYLLHEVGHPIYFMLTNMYRNTLEGEERDIFDKTLKIAGGRAASIFEEIFCDIISIYFGFGWDIEGFYNLLQNHLVNVMNVRPEYELDLGATKTRYNYAKKISDLKCLYFEYSPENSEILNLDIFMNRKDIIRIIRNIRKLKTFPINEELSNLENKALKTIRNFLGKGMEIAKLKLKKSILQSRLFYLDLGGDFGSNIEGKNIKCQISKLENEILEKELKMSENRREFISDIWYLCILDKRDKKIEDKMS